MMALMKPAWVVPLGTSRFRLCVSYGCPDWSRLMRVIVVLVHKSNTRENGSIFEAAAGHFSKISWQRSEGLQLRPDERLTPEVLLKH